MPIIQRCINDLLLDLGIPMHIRGYDYITTAILLVMEDETYISMVTKRLYPDIAKKHGASPTSVERGIRYGIEVAFDNAPLELMQKLFGNSISMNKGKATNTQFIATVSKHIKSIVEEG